MRFGVLSQQSAATSDVVGCGCYVAGEREFRIPVHVSRGVSEVLGGRWAECRTEVRRKEINTENAEWWIEMEAMSDDVHLLVEVNPQFGVHRSVRAVRGRSSRVLREQFPWLKSKPASLWTNSYFVATVGWCAAVGDRRCAEPQRDR